MTVENTTTVDKINVQENKNFNRIYFLDVLRAIACLCIVIIHISDGFIAKDFGTFNFWVGNIFDSLARIGVPLFVMISGTIFLDENYNFTNKKLVCHIKKIVIFFVFWSLFYSIFYNFFDSSANHDISIIKIISQTVTGHYHLWFCFMIVGLYLIIPLLRLWVKKENVKLVRYFIILSFIFSMFMPSVVECLSLLVPKFNSLYSIINNLNIQYIGGFTAYFILGWYLNNFKIKHKILLVFLGILGAIISVIGTAFFSIMLNEPHQIYGNLSVHVAFQTIMVYLLIKNNSVDSKKTNGFFRKIIIFIADNSLGVYAIHVVVQRYTGALFAKIGIVEPILYIPFAFVITTSVSLLISFIISKIPILKKVV